MTERFCVKKSQAEYLQYLESRVGQIDPLGREDGEYLTTDEDSGSCRANCTYAIDIYENIIAGVVVSHRIDVSGKCADGK